MPLIYANCAVTTTSITAFVVVAIENSQELPACTAKSVSYCTKFMLEPVEVPIVICPPVAKTASPSRMEFPEIFTKPQNSSPAPSQAKEIDKDFKLETFVGIVNELLTLAPAKLSNAWKLDVALRPLSDLDTTIAMVIFLCSEFKGSDSPENFRASQARYYQFSG